MSRLTFKKDRYFIVFLLATALIFLIWGGYYNIRVLQYVLRVDGIYYYSYLPCLFGKAQFADYFTDGQLFNKYPVGVAICEFPFFLIADIMSKIKGLSGTGWEMQYQKSVLISAIVYYCIGAVSCYGFLKKYFKPLPATLSIAVITWGTRLVHYSAIDGCLSHVYSFSIFSILLFAAQRYKIAGTLQDITQAFIIGLLSGLLLNIRNTNAIMLIMAAFLITNNHDLKIYYKRFITAFIAWSAGCFVLMSVQMAYWYRFTGKFILYSYGEESFDWFNPHIIGTLFGNDSITGILQGAPLIAVTIAAIPIAYKQLDRKLIMIAFCCLGINFYLTCSWWCWSALSRRTYVEYVPLNMLFLGALISQLIENKKKRQTYLYWIMITFCIMWSAYKNLQYAYYWV